MHIPDRYEKQSIFLDQYSPGRGELQAREIEIAACGGMTWRTLASQFVLWRILQ